MKTSDQLKMSIMGRVYVAYALRRVFHSSTVRAVLSVGSLAWIFSVVSVLNVLQNMPSLSNADALYTFSVTALSQTELTVQISLLVFLVVLGWYARDAVRGLALSRPHAI